MSTNNEQELSGSDVKRVALDVVILSLCTGLGYLGIEGFESLMTLLGIQDPNIPGEIKALISLGAMFKTELPFQVTDRFI